MSEVNVFSVPGISCAHCERAIKEEVLPLEGVEDVQVDLEAKKVRVVGTNLNPEKLVHAIAEGGYEATLI